MNGVLLSGSYLGPHLETSATRLSVDVRSVFRFIAALIYAKAKITFTNTKIPMLCLIFLEVLAGATHNFGFKSVSLPLWPPRRRAGRRISSAGLLLAVVTFATGCTAIDPQHVLTRGWGNGVPAEGAALDNGTRQRAYDFVWQRIADAYVDPNYNGVNWNLVGETQRAEILNAANDDVFWSRLDAMTAELGDAHTRVLSPRQYALQKTKQNNTLGIWLSEIDGAIVVTSVTPSSPGAKAGVMQGDRLLIIDGKPAADWWHGQKSAARKNSTDRAKLKWVKRVFNAGDPQAPSEALSFVVERASGDQEAMTLTRTVMPGNEALTSAIRPDGVGYMRLTGFDPELMGEVAPAFDRIRNAKALVIDVRGNPGGSLDLSLIIMDQLVGSPTLLGKRVTRSGKPPTFLFGLLSIGTIDLQLKGVAKPFRGPVVVLVDGDSASASELLSGALQATGRAQIVGETTCGCLLGSLGYTVVPGGGALAYSEMDFGLRSALRIEGVGVQPNYAVPQSRQDLQLGRDSALEKAVELLTGNL